MAVLRINQTKLDGNRFRATIAYDNREAIVNFDFDLKPEEQTDIRWYLEEYLRESDPSYDQIAKRVEALIQEKGTLLYRKIMATDDAAIAIWHTCMNNLPETRVEIQTSVEAASAIPWELIYVPRLESYLALEAQSFVRSYHEGVRRVVSEQAETVRVLLVICRPDAEQDVGFRSVASRILKSLGTKIGENIELEVLRPPTFASLTEKLSSAHHDGKPYHVVHFDGHGTYAQRTKVGDYRISSSMFNEADDDGKSGYLVFENPMNSNNREYVSGKQIGQLLARTRVPVLVLNACKSAYAESTGDGKKIEDDSSDKRQGEVAAYGSLAQEVMQAGVNGVVAMRYNVYVVTAAQFVADLYAKLAHGYTLGQAVSMGRKMLQHKAELSSGHKLFKLQDWVVPVVYESAPVQLFPQQVERDGLINIDINIDDNIEAEQPGLDDKLPRTPDLGFFGRDETLLALDRAFDTRHVVLLHAYAGSGKTTTAAEFARWYRLTGGLGNGVVLFTSFEQYRPLESVLADFGRVLGPSLVHSGIQWQALPDKEQRRQIVLQVLRQVPILWIWDNVESVYGFPRGTPSPWSKDEQQELADFLRDAKGTQGKFLLTSRLDEHEWLEDLPRRIEMPPMPMRERWQMAEEMVKESGSTFAYETWRPLLAYTGGNPLTLQVLVRQAIRENIRTAEAVTNFVGKLRAGEIDIDDDKEQGRSKSLGASLAYGFEKAFTAEERAQLAVLHLFQGFVDADALGYMAWEDNEWALDELRGKNGEYFVTLLDKAAAIGVLIKLGGTYYDIHPALPWFLRGEFEAHYPTQEARERTQHAYVEAIGYWGNNYATRYTNGQREIIHLLAREENNLLYARHLNIKNNWWDNMGAMQGLQPLYRLHGRRAEWRLLVEEIVPDFCEPQTSTPIPGRRLNHWLIIMHYRVYLAREERRWDEAEQLQQIAVEQGRKAAQPYLNLSAEELDNTGRNTIRSLAVALEALGNIQRERREKSCVASYEEGIPLCQKINDTVQEAIIAFNLGHAYRETVPTIRNLDEAEKWFKRSLDLSPEADNWAHAQGLSQLGLVDYERFMEARDMNDRETAHKHLNDALNHYTQALEIFPPNAINELAMVHNQLGNIYGDVSHFTESIAQHEKAIQYMEQAHNYYQAALTRFNIALTFDRQGRFDNALLFAQAALEGFQRYPNTEQDQENARGLIEAIKQDLEKSKGDGQ